MTEPIFTVGAYGTHITENSNGTFSFKGTVPRSCTMAFESFDDAVNAFLTFFRQQDTVWQRENVGNMRADIFERFFNKN